MVSNCAMYAKEHGWHGEGETDKTNETGKTGKTREERWKKIGQDDKMVPKTGWMEREEAAKKPAACMGSAWLARG